MADLPSPPLWLQGGTYAADDDRALIRSLVAGQGVVTAGDLAVTANGTPNMSVNVAPGRAFVLRTGATDYYLAEVDTTTNLTVSAADATNSRKDIVVVRVYDAAYSGTANKATLEVIAGTPAASPAEPAVPSNAIKLAVITVAAAATSITSAAIELPTNGVPIVTWASNAAGGAPVQTGFRNALRNGDLSVWQRGTGPFTAYGYTADGWLQDFSGGAMSTSRRPLALGEVAGAKYSIASAVSGQSAAGDYARLENRIEGVETYAGKQVTLSFRARASSGTPKIGVEIVQSFGTGGKPTVAALVPIGAVTLSTTMALYTVTFTVPSIAGKVLGSNGDDYLKVSLWLSSGSTNAARASSIGIQNATWSITQVQLEEGALATPFERLPHQQQLAWCQRYLWRRTAEFANEEFANGFWSSTTAGYILVTYPVRLRAAPSSISLGGTWNVLDPGGFGVVVSSLSSARMNTSGVVITFTTAGSGAAGAGTMVRFTNAGSGTYIEATAEL